MTDDLPPPVNPNPTPSPRSGFPPPVEHQFRPGNSGNKGGRPKGASTLEPFLREMAKDPDEDGYGAKAVEAARKLVEAVIAGDKDGVNAVLAVMDRTDGPLVKERVNTNIELVEGITLRDRRRDAPPVPGTSEEKKA
jgi:hypothetical protein